MHLVIGISHASVSYTFWRNRTRRHYTGRALRHFSRVPIYAHEIDQQWQADLADMNKCVDWNENVRYILVVVDTLQSQLGLSQAE